MEAAIRATCPNCRSSLKIPAQWAGQPVKCKKCGSVVRTKAAASPASAASATPPPHAYPTAPHPVPSHPVDPVPFADLSAGASAYPAAAGNYNPFTADEAPHPAAAPYGPNGHYPYAAAPAPMPAAYPGAPYPYPQPAAGGYPPAAPAYPYPGAVPAARPAPVAAPQAFASDFAPSEATSAYTGGKYRRDSGKSKYVWLGVGLVLTAGLVFGGIYGSKYIKQQLGMTGHGPGTEVANKGQNTNAQPTGNKGLLAGAVPYPRRMLFIHMSNYLYLNPLTSAAVSQGSRGPDKTRGAALRLAYEWRVPMDKENNQLYLLSDTAAGPDHRMPLKNVLTGTYEKFFDTSRPQDRIVVYFGGHVLSQKVDDKDVVFLVPVEGDPDDPASLIPLDDFYAKMKACKATQKVVIWDVCRFNPQRGRQRPGSEPMSEEVAKVLSSPPDGVQAVLTAQAGENALEFYDFEPNGAGKSYIAGSSFLESAKYVADKAGKGGKNTTSPNDPIPVDDWATNVGKRAAEVAGLYPDIKVKQTVKIAGSLPATLVAYKADEAASARFELPPAPKSASPEETLSIVREFTLPAIKKDAEDSGIADYPFPADALAPYKADIPEAEIKNPANREKYQFQRAVVDAFDTIRKVWGKNNGLREEFVGDSTDNVKKAVLDEQLFPAEAIPRLDQAIVLLEAVESMKENQSKRWQAHYEYALGQCKARLAFMHEYNLALGNIRTDVLPAKKPGDDGYKLVSAEKMKVKKEAKLAEEAREHFENIIMNFKGSPWAIQAKRDRALSLGLAWQSFNSKAAEAKEPQ